MEPENSTFHIAECITVPPTGLWDILISKCDCIFVLLVTAGEQLTVSW